MNKLITEWLPGGRDMMIVQAAFFVDSAGVLWDIAPDEIVNGASIPMLLWGAAGSPFVHKGREAAVFHDVWCTRRTRSYKKVHAMYYEAQLFYGAEPALAKLRYEAVAALGPRWRADGTEMFTRCPSDKAVVHFQSLFDPSLS